MGICQSVNICNPLQNQTFENTPEFSLDGQIKKAKVLKVYDGDTVWVALKIHGKVYKMKVRLNGIDTPELKPPLTTPNREKVIASAIKSKEFVARLIDQKIVTLKCYKFEKYGRLLADVSINKINLADELLKNKLAKPYDGKTKE